MIQLKIIICSQVLPFQITTSTIYVAISPLSTYMSGINFRVKPLKDINITSLLRSTIGNSYSHLDITLNLLLNGTLSFFFMVVIKGDIKFGGDGYRHKTKESLNKSFKTKNIDLNPDVYGPKARARQFYYRENLLHNLKKNIDFISICIVRLNHIDFFFRSIMRSNMLVILPENTILKMKHLMDTRIQKKIMNIQVRWLLISLPYFFDFQNIYQNLYFI